MLKVPQRRRMRHDRPNQVGTLWGEDPLTASPSDATRGLGCSTSRVFSAVDHIARVFAVCRGVCDVGKGLERNHRTASDEQRGGEQGRTDFGDSFHGNERNADAIGGITMGRDGSGHGVQCNFSPAGGLKLSRGFRIKGP